MAERFKPHRWNSFTPTYHSVSNNLFCLAIADFAFVADRNVCIDAYLVFGAESGCKPESRKTTTICCGFYFDETTTYGGVFNP